MRYFKVFCAVFLIFLAIFSTFFIFSFKTTFKNIVKTEAIESGVSTAIIFAVIKAESKFSPKAKSSAGAVGLMQIKPSTAVFVANLFLNQNKKNSQYNFDLAVFNSNSSNEEIENQLKKPEINIKLGTKYLKYLIDKFDNLQTAICAYNAGETVVKSWLENPNYSTDGKTLKVIPFPETKAYLKKVMFNFSIYQKMV